MSWAAQEETFPGFTPDGRPLSHVEAEKPCQFCSRRVIEAKNEGRPLVVEYKDGGPWFLKEQDGELKLSWWGLFKGNYKTHLCEEFKKHHEQRVFAAMARKFTNPEAYELEDIDPRAEEL